MHGSILKAVVMDNSINYSFLTTIFYLKINAADSLACQCITCFYLMRNDILVPHL